MVVYIISKTVNQSMEITVAAVGKQEYIGEYIVKNIHSWGFKQ